MPVSVRFPPSPTGKMHIGNARTALFNWLYARHTGGKFLFRIEDTDKERSTPENIAFIHEAMAWLGLAADNEPFLQTSRVNEHKKAAQKLLEEGKAFVDAEGVTRLHIPEGETTWDDMVQGPITIQNKEVDTFALLRSDGSPTYHLGVVVDDAFMGITHVVRGDDHVANTPKHILLFKALGYPVPRFGHLPLILGPDGAKLSKRHGAASIQDLRDEGYLPQAVFNYLIRLGWSHGDQEVFTRDEAVQLFDVEQVHPSPARFDAAKLAWMNEQYLKSLPVEEILPHLSRFLPNLTPAQTASLTTAWEGLTARAKTLKDLATAAEPLLEDATEKWESSPDAVKALMEGHMPLHKHYEALSAVTEWTEAILDKVFHTLIENNGNDFKTYGKPLRMALTARTSGLGLPTVMAALGQKETLRRIKSALHFGHEHHAAH